MKYTLALTLLLSLNSHAAVNRTVIKTDRGELPVIVNAPKGKGPHPLLVIAPAKKYLMDERLFSELAKQAAAAGFLAVRFNWGFAAKGAEPSKNFANEAADLNDVAQHYIRLNQTQKLKVFLAAKSMGSRAAMQAALTPYAGLLLLTPNCDKKDTFAKTYAPVFKAKRPVHIAISVDDPYCEVKQIYKSSEKLAPHLTLHTLKGDHNFVVDGEYRNQNAAIASSLNWLQNQR